MTSILRSLEAGSTPTDVLVNSLIQSIKKIHLRQKALPLSFSVSNLRKAYSSMEADDTQFSDKTAEFFL